MDKSNETKFKKLPKHVAVIPDGNRRWARNNNLPTFAGHKKGFDRVQEIIKHSRDLGIHTMTWWGFSTENWNRSKEEIDYLMRLYETNIDQNLKDAKKHECRIFHLGRKDRIPETLAKKIANAEEETKTFNKYCLNVAIDYGGHDEIIRAVQKTHEDVANGKISTDDLWNVVDKYNGKYPMYLFKNYLDTKDQPNPYVDLVIRTSGEQRTSGYLSWQIAYAEYFFTKLHMPDFDKEQFELALEAFGGRERRFGGNTDGVEYIATDVKAVSQSGL